MVPSASHFCDACGAAYHPQALYCSACGAPLQNFIKGAVIAARNPVTTAPTAASTTTGLLSHAHMLNRRYRIVSQVGKGGFGAVYKAEDIQFDNRLVAIKEMSQSALSPQEVLEATDAFRREARFLAGLTHPNLPRIYEQFSDMGRWYLVMDFIEGETLEERLQHLQNVSSPAKGTLGGLPVEKVLDIGIQLCTVLDYLHTRQPPIIFRDLKPANVMLTPDGHVYLIDFGIARHFKPGQAKDTMAFGSAGYAAPEQYGRSQTTPRADIYSLGATLHQLLSGNDPSETPFNFVPLQLRNHPTFSALETLILRMVEMDVNKRPATMPEIKQALQRIAMTGPLSGTGYPQAVPLHSGIPHGYRPPSSPPQSSQSSQSSQSPTFYKKAAQPQQGITLHICTGHNGRVTAVAWSPDSKYIASGSLDKKVHIWDAATGKLLLTYRGHRAQVYTVAWSPDGQHIASAGNDGVVHIWAAATGKQAFTYPNHPYQVHTVAWSPDGKRVASGGLDRTIHVWEVTPGDKVLIHRTPATSVNALAWSPDGAYIASAWNDQTVEIWDITKEQSKNFFLALFASRSSWTYNKHAARVNAIAWSPNGKYIASGSTDKTVKVWDPITGNQVFMYRNRSASVNAVAWSPDSRRIASGSNDKTVRVWDDIKKNSIFTYHGHIGYVIALAWSPDGTRIASAGVDRTVQIWKVV